MPQSAYVPFAVVMAVLGSHVGMEGVAYKMTTEKDGREEVKLRGHPAIARSEQTHFGFERKFSGEIN